MKTKVETTYDDDHTLAQLLNAKSRRTTVQVDRAMLWRLYRDHARLLQLTRGQVEGDI